MSHRPARAADPRAPASCWVGVGYGTHHSLCNGLPVAGRLTCPRHAALEAEAQALKAATRPKRKAKGA